MSLRQANPSQTPTNATSTIDFHNEYRNGSHLIAESHAGYRRIFKRSGFLLPPIQVEQPHD
jgi:hypothetical protein